MKSHPFDKIFEKILPFKSTLHFPFEFPRFLLIVKIFYQQIFKSLSVPVTQVRQKYLETLEIRYYRAFPDIHGSPLESSSLALRGKPFHKYSNS